ncbi:MAG: uroporphyrinogen-III C-methyltransferase [Acidiferrobacterales bacterium]
MSGKAYLVGAGPGDPELLTLKALRVLEEADVVLHDDLITPEVLALVPPTARLQNVGKRCGRRKTISQPEINALVVRCAKRGLTVVRLKGGDPLIFGRAGEEMDALHEAGVEFEVIPGVTAALGAAAVARLSLTDRRWASQVFFASNHRCAGKAKTDWQSVTASGATIVVYMPGSNYAELAAELCSAGMSGETLCVIVSHASTPQEQIYRTTLGKLPEVPPLPAPALLVIGAVAATDRSPEEAREEAKGVLVGAKG